MHAPPRPRSDRMHPCARPFEWDRRGRPSGSIPGGSTPCGQPWQKAVRRRLCANKPRNCGGYHTMLRAHGDRNRSDQTPKLTRLVSAAPGAAQRRVPNRHVGTCGAITYIENANMPRKLGRSRPPETVRRTSHAQMLTPKKTN